MITLLTVPLMIAAWFRGWRGYALIPEGAAIGLSLFIGIALGLADVSRASLQAVSFIGTGLEIYAACVLIFMIIVGGEKLWPEETQKRK